MERKRKPDLDERFSLYGEDPEKVIRKLMEDQEVCDDEEEPKP